MGFCEYFKDKLKSKKTILIFSILLLALIAELLMFVCEPCLWSFGTQTVLTQNPQYNPISVDCTFDGEKHTVTGADPQIIYSGLSEEVSYVVLELKNAPAKRTDVTLYYETTTSGFSEKTAVREQITPFGKRVVLRVPGDKLLSVRLDIDGDVEISSITLFDSKAIPGIRAVNEFSFARVVIIFIAMILVAALYYAWHRNRGKAGALNLIELLFIVACFIFYTIWNVTQFINYAPDEMMRLDVTFFLYENHRLPVGDELTHPIWGFSYAHMPTMLCNVVGYLFMLLATPFSTETLCLVIAARMVSVLAGTGTVYFVIKAAKLLFNSPSRWIMILLVALMPQFAFLSSYVNNDSLAVFGSAMIFYVWVYVIKNKWNYGIALLLVAGMSTCALSYYNSYGWILLSIPFFIITYFKQNPRKYRDFIKLAGTVSVLTLVLIGYMFIRHYVLYGDLLGMSTGQQYGEIYAQPGMKPSERFSLSEMGVSLRDMLFSKPYSWIKTTGASFFAVFGYMQYGAPKDVYLYYGILFGIGALGFVALTVSKIIKRQKFGLYPVLLYTSLVSVTLITVFLSIYNSYFNDFQPQGRYCYPALIPIALVVSRGFDYLVGLLKEEKHRYFAIGAVCSSLVVVSLLVFKIVFVQSVI